MPGPFVTWVFSSAKQAARRFCDEIEMAVVRLAKPFSILVNWRAVQFAKPQSRRPPEERRNLKTAGNSSTNVLLMSLMRSRVAAAAEMEWQLMKMIDPVYW